MKKKTRIIKIILVIIWMTGIFMFSHQKADDSTKTSNTFIKSTIGTVFNIKDQNKLNQFIKPVRKSAHFFLYLVLGILVKICFDDVNKRTILLSIGICILYSISDEIHQIFIEGRSAEVLDIFIDTAGSSLGIMICKLKAAKK